MIYTIGTTTFQAHINMPAAFEAFCADSGSDHNQEVRNVDIVIDQAPCTPNLLGADRRAVHGSITIWKDKGIWIFEDTTSENYLTVTYDYSHAWFYCRDERSFSFQPIIQLFIECSLIYSGIAVMHASCVSIDGKAILFSAPSGTGKSTRARLWAEQLGADWISGDRPAVNPEKLLVYGVPWDGKEQIFSNKSALIQAITEVRRSNMTVVRKMTDKQKRQFLAAQLLIPMWDPVLVQKAFLGMQQMIEWLPIYRLYCDITETSANQAYEILFHHPEKIWKAEEKE